MGMSQLSNEHFTHTQRERDVSKHVYGDFCRLCYEYWVAYECDIFYHASPSTVIQDVVDLETGKIHTHAPNHTLPECRIISKFAIEVAPSTSNTYLEGPRSWRQSAGSVEGWARVVSETMAGQGWFQIRWLDGYSLDAQTLH